MARICVTGIWHQGAVVSACLAELGHSVYGVCPPELADSLAAGRPAVHEPRLPAILRRNVRAGRLRYGSDYGEALDGADFVYISSDTPVDENDRPDLTPIYELAENIGRNLSGNAILCVTAQVPVGTTAELVRLVSEQTSHHCSAVYIPEFLQLGRAVDAFLRADRFVVGGDDPEVCERAADLYRPLGRPIVITDVRTSEMAKHAANAFLACSISFANEIGRVCEAVGADATQVATILRLDRRIGKHAPLWPGLGFAGGTLGRELRTLQGLGNEHSIELPLIDAVQAVNAARGRIVVERLAAALDGLSGRAIAMLGLTYKAGTSTLRRAASLEIAERLATEGASVKAFDPLAEASEAARLRFLEICDDAFAACKASDAVILLTPWAGLADLDLRRVRDVMRGDLFFDAANALDPGLVTKSGFRYMGIGRPAVPETLPPRR